MDRLAAAGVRFADAHAHNVLTLPSHANLLAGRHPLEHGVRDNAGFRFPEGVPTLAMLLRDRGYATGAFVSAFPLDSRFGLARGFDVYDDAVADGSGRATFAVTERAGVETVARARRWLDAQGGRPTFLWVHVYEPHYPYTPPAARAVASSAEAYRAEVAAADAALAPLLEPVLARGRDGRTLVVLTSDHGESLGEHGEATHGIFAYEPTLKVPLVVYHPRGPGGRVVPTPARHVDVLPTVLAALGVPVPARLPGRDLLSPDPPPADTPTYFEALSGQLHRGWAPLTGVIRAGVKYVDLPIPELYDLGRDPGETRNQAAAEPRRLDALRAVLAPLRAASPALAPGAVDAETRERLHGLGYLSAPARPRARYTEEDDPKRLIALDGILQEVVARYAAGDHAGALARCRELVARRPDMAVSHLHLGQLEREAGNLAAAAVALERAATLAPADTTALTLLGATLVQAGRPRQAVERLAAEASAAAPDPDLVAAYALALAKSGRVAEARVALDRAHRADPTSAAVLLQAGTVNLLAGDRTAARAAFQRALDLDPGHARVLTSLGTMAAEEGHRDEAVARFREAVASDPGEHRALLAVAGLLRDRGRAQEARALLELFVATAPDPAYAREKAAVRRWLEASAAPSRRPD
jgi:tetratricopeptide (TPR) repeat protein